MAQELSMKGLKLTGGSQVWSAGMLGLRMQGFVSHGAARSGIYGVGFGVQGLRFGGWWVWGVVDLGLGVWGFGAWTLGSEV